MKTNKEDVVKIRDVLERKIARYKPHTKWEAQNNRWLKHLKQMLKRFEHAVERWEEREKCHPNKVD